MSASGASGVQQNTKIVSNQPSREISCLNKPFNLTVKGLYRVTNLPTDFSSLSFKDLGTFKVLVKDVCLFALSLIATIGLTVATLGVGAIFIGREILAQKKDRAALAELPQLGNQNDQTKTQSDARGNGGTPSTSPPPPPSSPPPSMPPPPPPPPEGFKQKIPLSDLGESKPKDPSNSSTDKKDKILVDPQNSSMMDELNARLKNLGKGKQSGSAQPTVNNENKPTVTILSELLLLGDLSFNEEPSDSKTVTQPLVNNSAIDASKTVLSNPVEPTQSNLSVNDESKTVVSKPVESTQPNQPVNDASKTVLKTPANGPKINAPANNSSGTKAGSFLEMARNSELGKKFESFFAPKLNAKPVVNVATETNNSVDEQGGS